MIRSYGEMTLLGPVEGKGELKDLDEGWVCVKSKTWPRLISKEVPLPASVGLMIGGSHMLKLLPLTFAVRDISWFLLVVKNLVHNINPAPQLTLSLRLVVGLSYKGTQLGPALKRPAK